MHTLFTMIQEGNLNGVKAILMENEFSLDALLQERHDKGQTPQEFASKRLDMAQAKLGALVRTFDKGKCTQADVTAGEKKFALAEKILLVLNRVANMPKPQVTSFRATTYSVDDALNRVEAARNAELKELAQKTTQQLAPIIDGMSLATLTS